MDLKERYNRLEKLKFCRDKLIEMISLEEQCILEAFAKKGKTSNKVKTNPILGHQSSTRIQSETNEDHAALIALMPVPDTVDVQSSIMEYVKKEKRTIEAEPQTSSVTVDRPKRTTKTFTQIEKIKLAFSIKNLPRNRLGKVVRIIKNREISLRGVDPDNIEFDLLQLKDSTILELVRYTNMCKYL